LTCTVVEDVVAARLRGFLTKKINPEDFSARK
jgi:hypothetical protein